MCGLCDPKTRAGEKKNLESQAESLERLAQSFRYMASGVIKPHTDDAQVVGQYARYAVKFLAEWI